MRDSRYIKNLIENSQELRLLRKTLETLTDKWSILIIICIFHEPKRFTDIQKFTEGITPRMLTIRLNALVEQGLIKKIEYKEFPPRTEYQATDMALELKKSIKELRNWSKKYLH